MKGNMEHKRNTAILVGLKSEKYTIENKDK